MKDLQEAKQFLRKHSDVTSVGWGYRHRKGIRQKQECLVVGVRKKKARAEIMPMKIIPYVIKGMETDVQENVFVAFSHVTKMRPCPAGFSIGHPRISAGTLGAWVKRGNSDDYFVLSNNHVIAASNEGLLNDIIIQQGKADGGFSNSHAFARLTEYVHINFIGDEDKKKVADFLWKAWSAPANLVAKLIGCPYRLRTLVPQRVDQPALNLVDAAIAKPLTQGYVNLDPVGQIGELKGLKDLQLGDNVQKEGRTTEYTTGVITVVDMLVQVGYGRSGIAWFDNQVEVRGKDFSDSGDSGSAIVTEDGFLGGLLFAGGEGATIANRISNVVSLLGVRL